MSEWQIIETAPKNGARIIALCNAYMYDRRSYDYKLVGKAVADIYWCDDCWREWLGAPYLCGTGRPDPTHWMPLPAPPIDKEVTA